MQRPCLSPKTLALGKAFSPEAQGKASNSSNPLPPFTWGRGIWQIVPLPSMVIQRCPSLPVTVLTSAFVRPIYKALTWPTKEVQGLRGAARSLMWPSRGDTKLRGASSLAL